METPIKVLASVLKDDLVASGIAEHEVKKLVDKGVPKKLLLATVPTSFYGIENISEV